MPARKSMTFRDEINTRISLVLVQLERIKADSELSLEALLEEIEEVSADLDTVEGKVRAKVNAAKDAIAFAD